MTTETWEDAQERCFGMLLDGRAQATGISGAASDATLLLVVNAHHDVGEVHAARGGRRHALGL